jgi:hypothetical protein
MPNAPETVVPFVSDAGDVPEGVVPRSAEIVRLRFLARQMRESITAMLAGKTPAESLHLFSNTTANWTASDFVPNENLWCQSLRSQLTGVHMYVSGGWMQGYGLTAITPRHVLSCAHNGPQGNSNLTVRYVRETGEVFETHLARWCCDSTYNAAKVNVPQETSRADLSVYLLADELPEWVYKAPVIPLTGSELNAMWAYAPMTLAVSQGSWIIPGPGETPRNRMVYPKYGVGLEDWTHPLQVGDSGTPEFVLISGRLYLYNIISGANVWSNIDYIREMIARCDAAAGISTGYVPETGNFIFIPNN